MSENNKGSLALKERLAQRKQMVEEVQTQGEIDALPKSQTEAVLVQMQGTLAKMLPNTMPQDQAMKLVNNTIQLIRQTPNLAACGQSLMGGVLTAAQLGLELGVNALGEAYLLPFQRNKKVNGNWEKTWEATLIIGYKGYRKLAWQTNFIKEISREIVYSNDDFRVQYGTNRGLHHIPAEGDRGNVKGYYATVVNRTGGVMFTYMTLGEVENHRDNYAMAKKRDGTIVGPWKDNFHEMALKTVLLKTLRDGPLSVEDKMGAAMHLDGSVRYDTTQDYSDPRELLNASTLTEAFTPNGVNVVEGETVESSDEDAIEVESEDTPAPQSRPAAAPTGTSEVEFIKSWCKANKEDPLDVISSAIGVSYEKLQDYSPAEIAEAAAALRETIGQG